MARGAARSKQKERAAGATRSKKKERTAGQEKGGNPEEEKKDAVRAARFAGSGNGVRLCMKERNATADHARRW